MKRSNNDDDIVIITTKNTEKTMHSYLKNQDPKTTDMTKEWFYTIYDSYYQKMNTNDDKMIENLFNEKYTVKEEIIADSFITSTKFNVFKKEENNQNLFMKNIPLPIINNDYFDLSFRNEDIINEVFNEITIGYFLNQLNCIHFNTIIDWFILYRKYDITQIKSILDLQYLDENDKIELNDLIKNNNKIYTYTAHQIIISEKADFILCEYLYQYPYINTLRSILFQIYYTLELAWNEFGYTHNDLHDRNIMLKHCINNNNNNTSTNLIYNRKEYNNNQSYSIPKSDTNNYIVKIIDYGRNRIHLNKNKNSNIDNVLFTTTTTTTTNNNERIIMPNGWEDFGYPKDKPNRQMDINVLIFSLLTTLKPLYWEKLDRDDKEGLNSFYDMCNTVIDFKKINNIMDNVRRMIPTDVLYIGLGNYSIKAFHIHNEIDEITINSRNIRNLKHTLQYLQTPGIFLYKYTDNGSNASTILNHPFLSYYLINKL